MEKQKDRSEIAIKDTWDLTVIYKDEEEFYKDFSALKEEIKNISSFKGCLLKSAKNLLNYFKCSEKIERKLYKLYYYAHLTNDQDTTNTNSQKLLGMIENLTVEYSTLTSFVIPELMKSNYDLVLKYISELEELKDYKFQLENIYRYKKHTLSSKDEKMLSVLGKTLSNASSTYDALTDADMCYGNIIVDGKEIELTASNYSIYIKNKNRDVRKQAFETLYKEYIKNKFTITSTFTGNIDSLASLAQIRKYKSSIDASLFDDNINVRVYNNLIKTVNKHLDVLDKYYELKKNVLKLDELHMYDVYAEMVPSLSKKYSFEEAKNIVLDALSILGSDYVSNLNKAFDERWIDIYNNKGKRSGAYSSGFYDTYPYVLLNYEGSYNDISTLAHELGHSMHTYYSCHNNTYINSQYEIFVAEVASTVNELILAHYMLEKSNDKEEKLYILNQLMELFKGTIYRQTMFAEFEKDMHAKYENKEILTSELLNESYYKLNQKYYSKVISDEEIKYEWERIPHFYYNFYVYKYAIGLSSACKIYKNIKETTDGLEKYLNFLKSGGSNYPANLLLIAGVDVKDDEVISSAISMFDDTILEFISLYNK